VARQLTVRTFPKLDEPEDLRCLFAFAEIGVRVAESASVEILGEEGEHALLAATAHRDEVPLHDLVLPEVGNRVEVEVERIPREEFFGGDARVVGFRIW
jgi:PP-loop superfamily ATP-utilizing enzyme